MHILDVAENSIRAAAKNVEIQFIEDTKKDVLTIKIDDDGNGMAKETLERIFDPFFSTKKEKKIGLGLSMLKQAALESNGDIRVDSKVGKGTHIEAVFKYSHPDRKPIGNMLETLRTLICANPKVNFTYIHKKDGRKICYFKS